ncbi:MAG: phosphatidate cytidylyltransferase [Bacteroidales bacterium]|nr:phosphatidate cytidylyltransferase [Bacteroidales bacterium]
MSNFWQRTLSGILIVAAIIGALLGGPLSFMLLFAGITALGLYEFLQMVSADQVRVSGFLIMAAGVMVFILHFLVAGHYISPSALSWLLILPLIIWVDEIFRKRSHPMRNLAYSLTGLIYPATMMSSLSYLAYLGASENTFNHSLLISLFLLIWTHDTFAYLTGKKLGKHKLLPRISPGKSWEGMAGGLLTSMLVAFLLFRLQGGMALIHWLVMAVIVTLAGTLGDLCESYLKRSFGVKDSGSLIPGHGGMLDRFDAALFIFPVAYLYLYQVL